MHLLVLGLLARQGVVVERRVVGRRVAAVLTVVTQGFQEMADVVLADAAVVAAAGEAGKGQ